MEITITKGQGEDRIAIVHADGRRMDTTFPKKGFIPHDAVHLFVERELGLRQAFWGMVDWYNELISDSSMGPRNCGFRVELRLENTDLQSLTPQLTGFRERFFRHVRTRFVPLDQYCRQLRAFLLLFIERGGLTKRCRDNLLTAHQKKAYCALMLVCGLFFQKQHDYLHAGVAFGQAPNPWGNMPLPDGYQEGSAFMSTSDNPYDDLEPLDEARLNQFIIQTNNRQVRGPLGLPGDPLQAGVLRRRRLPVAPVLPPAAGLMKYFLDMRC